MDKKDIESANFKSFRNLIPSFPEGEVRHEDAPDFLIYTEKGVIGVEHCQLFQSPTEKCEKRVLQARESEINDVLERAKENAELRGMPPVSAIFTFRYDQDNTKGLNKQGRIKLGREITNAVDKNLPQENNSIFITWPDTYKYGFPEEISSASLSRYGQQHIWTWCEAAESISGCKYIKLMQQTIDKKAEKLSSYKNGWGLTECWLLIVANGLKPSGLFEINDTERNHTYRSPFDRTYFLYHSDPQPLFRLKTENAV